MKSVVALLGSPRRGGNSETISDKIMDTAKSRGALTTKFALNELSFRGCQACMACKTGSEICVVNDDLAQVLDAVSQADVLIMASPIYFGEVTGQMKSAIDRMYSFLGPDYLTNPNPGRLAPGKKCVFVLTQGNPDKNAFDVFAKYERFFTRFGFDVTVFRGLGLRAKTDSAENAEVMKQAEELAKKLVQ
jgi:multimeric flavodoxin WrbA